MKKLDGFLLTVLILIFLLAGVFYYAYSTLNYFDQNSDLQAKYERRKSLISLADKLKKLDEQNKLVAGSRAPAAVSNDSKENQEARNDAEAAKLSKKYFKIAKQKCYELNGELDCLRTIEEAVTHYPESEWTGQSLVILTDFYYRTKRIGQAREILRILKKDFKNYSAIQEKVVIIERHLK